MVCLSIWWLLFVYVQAVSDNYCCCFSCFCCCPVLFYQYHVFIKVLPSALSLEDSSKWEQGTCKKGVKIFHLFVEWCQPSKNKAKEQLHADFLSKMMFIVDCLGGPAGKAECPLCLPVPVPYWYLSYLLLIEILYFSWKVGHQIASKLDLVPSINIFPSPRARWVKPNSTITYDSLPLSHGSGSFDMVRGEWRCEVSSKLWIFWHVWFLWHV